LPPSNEGVEFVRGDVGDPHTVERALEGVDQVLHLAAAVGVGQSMYEPGMYVRANSHATAVLLQKAVQAKVRRIVTASSMSIYGEGLYQDADGRPVETRREGGRAGAWDPVDAQGRPLRPVPTPETKTPDLSSVYALTKYDQERLTLMMGDAYGIPSLALRFFNTYGPGQALQNPYTGVLAIFGARLRNAQPPLVFEDGRQQRDFVHVDDVARACCLALDSEAANMAVNVGTGDPRSVLDVAAELDKALGTGIQPEVTQKRRAGDIRHCYADTRRARQVLGFEAKTTFRDGVQELARWISGQKPEDRVEHARRELESRGLVR
ncbi:MAG TPA: NAD-dependent epimerase/dehydratase family protein, partial [Candidatus Thermoplasmatota archaeon]|nr:NAD-dependent epimerase/dehydratase family protein [Candidatus Thermoplasmatota archaeon]